MSILLIDFEATGVEPKKDRIIEIGAMVTDLEFNLPTHSFSTLVHDSDYPEISDEVSRVTNITKEMLETQSKKPIEAFHELGELVSGDIQYVIAYNTSYDHTLFQEEMFRHHLTMNPAMNWLLAVPWLCALNDIERNYDFKSRRLMHVALEYGVTVNPKLLHRAIADVELMRQMLQAADITPQKMYDFQIEPWIYVRALVEAPWTDGGRSTDLAKKQGYAWERARGDTTDRVFKKSWIKRIKEKSFDNELTLPFQVERIMI